MFAMSYTKPLVEITLIVERGVFIKDVHHLLFILISALTHVSHYWVMHDNLEEIFMHGCLGDLQVIVVVF